MGEPGIGKSRLIEEFRVRIKDQPHSWIECAGEQFSASTPFHAVIQILDQGLLWRGDESKEECVVQLEGSLELTGLKLGEAVPLIAEMLNLPIPANYKPLMFAPDQKRRRLLANLATWVINATRLQPVIIAMEDLHWVDPSTLELQQTLVEQAATTRLMLLCTSRPEFRAPWPMRAHHAQVTLSRLNDRHMHEMVAGVAARSALTQDAIDTVVKRTDGVPLFAEELTRLMLEGDGRSLTRDIPATLADALMARLDRLGTAKEVAQLAAVLGREFSYEMLHAVSPMAEDELQAALAKLGDFELIYARGIAPEATYQFKHSLIRDAAYEALLKSRRRELHRLVARTMADKFQAVADAQPEALAHHWTEAGEAELAIAAWQKVADKAYARHAFKEAEESYKQALTILKTIPESAGRDARELDLMSPLVRVLQVTKGWTAAQTVEAVARSQALAEKSDDLVKLVLQVHGTWARVLVAGDYSVALGLADQLLDLAQREGSGASLGFAYQAELTTRLHCGDLAGSEEHFVRGLEFFDSPGFRQAPGYHAYAFCFGGQNAWLTGRAGTARERSRQAIAAARESNSPYDLVSAQVNSATVNAFLREPAQVETLSAQALALSEAHGFPYFAAASRVGLGWAQAHHGRAREGVALIRQGLDANAGTRLTITLLLAFLAEAQVLDGATAEALGTIDEALVANPEELYHRPEAFRVRGELRLKNGEDELAQADFRESIALAKRMGAKAWELRANTSLARLVAKRGRRDEARAMLSEIYNWFTEGFDTADLKEAKALLDELKV